MTLDKSYKCIADIKNTAEDLKMKLLRSSVPNELFNRELNSIADLCRILIGDARNDIQKISASNIQQTPLLRNNIPNADLNISDDFFDKDPFVNSETDSAKKLSVVPPMHFLDKTLLTHVDKSKTSRKRTNDCLSEPASTTVESLHRGRDYTEDESGWVTAFIDGSCLNNGKGNARAGLGVWFSASSTLNLSEPVKGRLTNNVGEIEAANRAIEQAHSVGITKLLLKTDSMFLVNCIMKWRLTWEKNGWKTSANKPVINRIEIQKLTKTLDETKIAVRWEYVKAHSNIEGNEAADLLAKQGAEKCGLRTFQSKQ